MIYISVANVFCFLSSLPLPPTLIKRKSNFPHTVYKEIQNVAVGKSYMTNGLLILGEIFALFLMEALPHI